MSGPLRIAILFVFVMITTVSIASAGDVSVLWYTALTTDGGNFASYETGVQDLASNAPNGTAGNTWNVTFWDSGVMPTGNFNVLVVASPQFIDGGDYTALNAAIPSFGDRVLITGIDADWHYMNTPGSAGFDGPQGFLLNAVDWAAGGNGMGAVFLAPQSNIAWNFQGLGNEVSYDGLDNVALASGTENYAIQTGLDGAGLSNWATSAKEAFDSFDTAQWTALQVSGDDPGNAVTLASTATAALGLTPDTSSTAPEPASLLMAVAGFAALFSLARAKRRTAR